MVTSYMSKTAALFLLPFLFLLMTLSSAACSGSSDDSSSESGDHASAGSSAEGDDASLEDGPRASARHDRMASVENWFYFLDTGLEEKTIGLMEASGYDMFVIEPVFTEKGSEDFPIADVVSRLKGDDGSRLVVAYIDFAQAESWRTYWEPGWAAGDPGWIIGADPDGWEDVYTVAYWEPQWQQIWLGQDGYLQQIIDAGFDGVYLDWVEAYSDEAVVAVAAEAGVEPRAEMIDWVGQVAAFGRSQKPDFIVIGQNAAELAESEKYLELIDAISQEQVWFDGGADNEPPGDCPLPETEDDVGSESYRDSLSPECLRQYHDYPQSTLHVSSESYLTYLEEALDEGEVVFTVDYAIKPENVAWVHGTSRRLGFIPFVSERGLATWVEPHS